MLLLRALRRSRVVPRLHVPTADELRLLSGTFGILTVFYAAKNFSYLLLQVGSWPAGRVSEAALQLSDALQTTVACVQPRRSTVRPCR